MFTSSSWSRDPFPHFNIPSHPLPIHTYTSAVPQTNPYYREYPRKPARPHHSSKPQHHGGDYTDTRRRPHIEPESSDFTDVQYDTDSTFNDHRRTPHFHSVSPQTPALRTLSVQVPACTPATLNRGSILILPPTLTHLRVQFRTPYATNILHVSVAGDMSLRDVAKQLLPSREWRDTRVYAKLRGEWQETGALVMLSAIGELGRFGRNGAGKIEVRVVVGSNRRESGGGRRHADAERGARGVCGMNRERETNNVKGWEREMAWLDRMRLY